MTPDATQRRRGVREYLRECVLTGTAIVVPVLLTTVVLLVGLILTAITA